MVISRFRFIIAVVFAGTACATARSTSVARAPLALSAPDGTSTTLDEVRRGRDATVLVFWSATCPCVRRYQERADALLDAYPNDRVRVVGVSSNAGESFDEVLRVSKERQVRIPIFRDESGRVADALGVHSTPTVVVLDASGAVRFLGGSTTSGSRATRGGSRGSTGRSRACWTGRARSPRGRPPTAAPSPVRCSAPSRALAAPSTDRKENVMNRIALSLGIAVALGGCTSDTKDPSAPKTSLGTAPAGDLTVELLTDTRLETGMTPVYVKVTTGTGQVVTDAAVTFTPVMAMTGGTSHGAPVIGGPALGADGLYHCAVVFQMATSDMGSWSASVGVMRPGSPAVEASFPSLTVADSGRAKTFSYTDPDTAAVTKYVASLNFEAAPRVGLNPVVVTLHRMQDMMTFVPVDDAVFVLDPQMPSMGHGSPGSVNPTLASSGVYEGQLSFSMAGDWETTVTVSRAGVTIGEPNFAITF